jgi:hypothetical protein
MSRLSSFPVWAQLTLFVPAGGTRSPPSKMAPLFTGSAHTPLPGSGTVVASAVYTTKVEWKCRLRRQKRERLAHAAECECTEVQCTVQRVQPGRGHHCVRRRSDRYDSIGLHSSLYTGAVQGYWSTPNWSDRRQGCRQVSTSWSLKTKDLMAPTPKPRTFINKKCIHGFFLFFSPICYLANDELSNLSSIHRAIL